MMLVLAIGLVAKAAATKGRLDTLAWAAVAAEVVALGLLCSGRRLEGAICALGFYSCAAMFHLAFPARGCACLGDLFSDRFRMEILVAAVGGLLSLLLVLSQTAASKVRSS
ncbi:MAG: hypothetical protein JNK49_12805 [Planctomycetes bacterium]|nr:hypothetical protein [Planctomycetota bacterium]